MLAIGSWLCYSGETTMAGHGAVCLLITLLSPVRFTLSLLYRIGGHKREFSLTDITIQRPFAEHETVPPTLLMVVSIIIPAAFITIISTLVYRSKWDLHGGLLGLLVSYTVTGVVTQVVKMGVGR